MCLLTLDWGDVPTWVGALTTLGALIAAGALVKVELRRDRRTEREAQQRRDGQARAEQADLVAAWKDQKDSDSWATIRNGSELPVYDVELELFETTGTVRQYTVEVGVVPPSDHMDIWVVQNSVGTDVHSPGRPREFAVSITFRDTAGREWKRDTAGVLHQTGGPTRSG
jgi:hypothetical protein